MSARVPSTTVVLGSLLGAITVAPASTALATSGAGARHASTQDSAAAADTIPLRAMRPVHVERAEGKLVVRFGDELFTEYHHASDTPVPYFHPLLAPSGVAMTRAHPLELAPADDRDHPHHRSLWFAHGSVNGFDFWHGTERGERIVTEEATVVRTGEALGIARVRNRWEARGAAVCVEESTFSFFERADERVLDVDVTLRPAAGELVLGDTKEGTMAMRLVSPLRLRGDGASGHARNAAGERDLACWGRRAAWIDTWGPLGGEIAGVLILDHPGNFAHPTWWHARDYGLCAANPFGVHDFEQAPAGTGEKRVAPGESLRLRWRFVFHAGEIADARAAEHLAEMGAAR